MKHSDDIRFRLGFQDDGSVSVKKLQQEAKRTHTPLVHRIVAPKVVHDVILWTCEYIPLHVKSGFADVTKLRILRWVIMMGQIPKALKRGREKGRVSEGDVMTETEVRVMRPWQAQEASKIWKRRRTTPHPLSGSRRNPALPACFRLLTSKTVQK